MEIEMTKLLTAYAANPSLKMARKLRAHDQAHPMARCMLTVTELELLVSAIHLVELEG